MAAPRLRPFQHQRRYDVDNPITFVSGPASFLRGALSDRFGTRSVVLAGGALLGIGLVGASQAATIGQFQLLFAVLIGVAAGSFYASRPRPRHIGSPGIAASRWPWFRPAR